MALNIKRFSWLAAPSGWQTFQAWQEKRKAMRADFEFASSTAINSFASAWSSQIEGSASLAGQAALDRIRAAGKAKIDKIA
jgi:hypothetical protein